jgi:hypothetical protein
MSDPIGGGVVLDVDLCPECLMVIENGTTEDVDPSWPGLLEEWAGWTFAALACGGQDVDDLYCEGHYVAPGRRCDGCGSGLGGDRFCYVAFPTPGTAKSGPVRLVDGSVRIE